MKRFIHPSITTARPAFIAIHPVRAASTAERSAFSKSKSSSAPSAASPAAAPNSVAVGHGEKAVAVTDVPRSSSASASVNERTYALVAP